MKYSNEDKTKILEQLSKIDKEIDYKISASDSGIVITKPVGFEITKDLRIEGCFPLLFLGKVHCIILNAKHFSEIFEFYKISTSSVKIKNLEVDYNKSALTVEFNEFSLVLFSTEKAGWQIFKSGEISVECIENGGIEI